jgi:hypothetical protein
MGTGSLVLALLSLAVGAPSADVVPMNKHDFKIPIQVADGQRDKIKELILFVSTDQGITWQEAAVVNPDQDAFAFHAPADGLYWFNICLVDAQGKRQPPDIYKTAPRCKVLIDTQKPSVRIVSAERQGDEIAVKWEVIDDHPDLTSLKLEYRTPEAPSWMWFTTPITPAMSGQTTFKAVPGNVSLRLQMMDVAGNLGTDQKEVVSKAASIIATAATATSGATTTSPGTTTAGSSPPILNATNAAQATTTPPVGGASPLPVPDMTAAASPGTSPVTPDKPPSAPPVPPPTRNLAGSSWEQMSSVPQTPAAQTEWRGDPQRSWGGPSASRQPPPNTSYVDNESRYNPIPGTQTSAEQQPRPLAPRWSGGALVPLQITNNPQVSLDYEVTKVGHSGIGRVALYLTKDEGRTWELYGEDPHLKPPMVVNLPGEGVYGLRIVVTSRAGLGGKPPIPGDAPQMRVEVDTTPPAVKLFYPQPDPHRRNALVLSWSATDHSLAPNPITLQWAERPDGVWQTIATDLGNTGRYIWQPSANMPYRVYLRVLARDTAGNVAVDESPEPVLIDLLEPEGQLLGITGAPRRP